MYNFTFVRIEPMGGERSLRQICNAQVNGIKLREAPIRQCEHVNKLPYRTRNNNLVTPSSSEPDGTIAISAQSVT